MSQKKDHSALIEQNIRKLGDQLNSPLSEEYDDALFELACEYASENPGDYFLTLPGIILPILS